MRCCRVFQLTELHHCVWDLAAPQGYQGLEQTAGSMNNTHKNGQQACDQIYGLAHMPGHQLYAVTYITATTLKHPLPVHCFASLCGNGEKVPLLMVSAIQAGTAAPLS